MNVIDVPVREPSPEIDVLQMSPCKSPIQSEQKEVAYGKAFVLIY